MDYSHVRLFHFFACQMHFLLYLHAPSLTSLPNQICCSEDMLECFWYQGLASISAYLSLDVKPCYNHFWWFISVLYIRSLSGQHVMRTGLCTCLGWLNRYADLFITLLYLLSLQIRQVCFYSLTIGGYIFSL